MERSDKRERAIDASGLVGGLAGRELANGHAAATDAMRAGMELFRQAAEQHGGKAVSFSQGNLFEYIEAAKFNADAALKHSDLRAIVTEAIGRPTDTRADILIQNTRTGELVREVQAKSYAPPTKPGVIASHVRELSQESYKGTQRLTNPENADAIRDLAAKRADLPNAPEVYRDTADSMTGRLHEGDVGSRRGTSHAEATRAAEHPDHYAAGVNRGYVIREVAVTGVAAAGAAAVMGGALSAVRNFGEVKRGEITKDEALRNIATDAGKAGLRGAGVGVGSALIRVTAERAGVSALAKTNVATAVAAGLIDVGVAVYRYAKGELAPIDLTQSLVRTGTTTAASIYAGALAGAAFGPVGALVGSVVGYMLASYVVEAGFAILKQGRLLEEETARIEALCYEAARRMRAATEEFREVFGAALAERKEQLDELMQAIDAGLASASPEQTAAALTNFAAAFGRELKLGSFADFDRFMRRSNEPIRI